MCVYDIIHFAVPVLMWCMYPDRAGVILDFMPHQGQSHSPSWRSQVPVGPSVLAGDPAQSPLEHKIHDDPGPGGP